MPIFTIGKKRILFIHIPKTGGVSITRWLREKGTIAFSALDYPSTFRCNPQHFTMSDILFLFGGVAWDRAFTIVRDPYDRIESEFFWRHNIKSYRLGLQTDFATWLEASLEISS